MTIMTDSAEIEAVAKGLTKAQREAVLRFSHNWQTSGEAGATGMGATLLCVWRDILAERRWATWGADRVNGQKRGEGYEYRLTPLGIAVRAYLQSAERER